MPELPIIHTFWIILAPCLLVLGTWNLTGTTTEQVPAGLQRQGRASGNDLSQSYCCCSVMKSWPTLCSPMDCSIAGPPSFTISWSYYCMILTMLWPNSSLLPPWLMNNIHIISFLKFEVTIPSWRIYHCLWPP